MRAASESLASIPKGGRTIARLPDDGTFSLYLPPSFSFPVSGVHMYIYIYVRVRLYVYVYVCFSGIGRLFILRVRINVSRSCCVNGGFLDNGEFFFSYEFYCDLIIIV